MSIRPLDPPIFFEGFLTIAAGTPIRRATSTAATPTHQHPAAPESMPNPRLSHQIPPTPAEAWVGGLNEFEELSEGHFIQPFHTNPKITIEVTKIDDVEYLLTITLDESIGIFEAERGEVYIWAFWKAEDLISAIPERHVFTMASAVPEPSAAGLMLLGFAFLGRLRKRRLVS